MTVKTKATNPSSVFSTPSTVTDDVYARVIETPDGHDGEDIAPLIQATMVEDSNVVSNTTVAPTLTLDQSHPQQENPSFTHAVRTQVGQIVVTETPLHSDRAPAYISAQGPVDMPSRCQVHREGDQTVIQIRWFSSSIFGLTLFTIIWNCFIVFSLFAAGWFVLLIPHTWIGVYLLYSTVCDFLNSTYITISHNCVQVDQRPLKLCTPLKTTQFNKNGNAEIRVKRHVDTTSRGDVNITYELHNWDTRTGSFTVLPVRHRQMDVALFVAQEIQKYLSPRIGPSARATAEEVEMV